MLESLATPISDSAAVLRHLGSFEHLLWLRDQTKARHFALAARIDGRTTINAWRAALDLLQRRHPLFSVCIETNENDAPYFHQVASPPIPLRTVRGVPPNWETELERELFIPFNPQQAPLLRAVLLHEKQRAVFILVAHHAIADGLSIAFAIRDTLHAVSGGRLELLAPLPSIDELLGLGGEVWQKASSPHLDSSPSKGPATDRRKAKSVPRIERLALTPRMTQALRERCRQERTTVHAALCAALVLANRLLTDQWKGIPIRISSPVNARKLLGLGDDCGLLLGSATVSFEPDESRTFWDVARHAKAGLAHAQTLEGVAEYTSIMHQAIRNQIDVRSAEKALAFDMMVTNLGNLPYETPFGELTLEELWGPAVLAGTVENIQTIGAATTNGALCLVHSSYKPIEKLLDVTEQIFVSELSEKGQES
jgi:hypothetical protein